MSAEKCDSGEDKIYEDTEVQQLEEQLRRVKCPLCPFDSLSLHLSFQHFEIHLTFHWETGASG